MSINKNTIKHINDQQIILQKHILDVKLMSNNYSRHWRHEGAVTRYFGRFFSKTHYMYRA